MISPTISPQTQQISILNHGFVRLDAAEASDLSVANSARVSFGKRKTEMDSSDIGLIHFLMKNKHATPFEHNFFRWHVRCPISVAREWMRHRLGSFNEYSMRYTKAIDEFYIPAKEDVRSQVGKPGSYHFETLDASTASLAIQTMQDFYRVAWDTYESLLKLGVAKELSRNVIPVGIYTEFIWRLNARWLMNFLSLRNADAAMLEIRRYAEAIEQIFAEWMPVTHHAFVECG